MLKAKSLVTFVRNGKWRANGTGVHGRPRSRAHPTSGTRLARLVSTVMKTILVVDDDLAIREFLSDALAAEGYRVLAVGTGRRAFEIAKEERPDLVLADVMLPDLSGRELIRRIKGNEDISSTPVIVMSAALPSDAPGVAFLPKPFDLDDVVGAVALTLAPQATVAAESIASRSENLPR